MKPPSKCIADREVVPFGRPTILCRDSHRCQQHRTDRFRRVAAVGSMLKETKQLIKKLPVVRSVARSVIAICGFAHYICEWIKPFEGSREYWIDRYDSGGDSGNGSYGKYASFKAQIINEIVARNGIRSVIEYGCGDGNQLRLAKYPSYIGFDVSPKAIALCEKMYIDDPYKKFRLMDDYNNETVDLTLSIDVIYCLVEDDVFYSYMDTLFDSSERYVIIYSSDSNELPKSALGHIKHRQFTRYVADAKPGWKLIKYIPNRYPYNRGGPMNRHEQGSVADFFVYERLGTSGSTMGRRSLKR